MTIINFGSINIDHVYHVDHFVQPGETIASTNYQQLLGGKGANQSIALAAAGADVRHAGRINENDSTIKQTLIKSGIDCRFLRCTDVPTGHAIIQVTPSGENAIVLFGGANLSFSADDINDVIEQTQAGDWVLMQNETNEIGVVIEQAKQRGLKVAFNPAPMTESVKQLPLHQVDLLIVNETEAAAICGVDELADITRYFQQHWPAQKVIITLGKQGVRMLQDGTIIDVPAFMVDAVDTTAAGDTFIGFFLAHYTAEAAINAQTQVDDVLQLACAASALAVTKPGAAQSIPTLTEVQQFLAEHAK